MSNAPEGSEAAVERGWTRDYDVSRNRRPRQRIEPEDWPDDRGGVVEITPGWRYACKECGDERRFATETPTTEYHCTECGQVQTYEALGELIYPEEVDDE